MGIAHAGREVMCGSFTSVPAVADIMGGEVAGTTVFVLDVFELSRLNRKNRRDEQPQFAILQRTTNEQQTAISYS